MNQGFKQFFQTMNNKPTSTRWILWILVAKYATYKHIYGIHFNFKMDTEAIYTYSYTIFHTKIPSVWKRYGIFPYRQPQYPVRDLSILTIFRYGKNFTLHTTNPLPSNTSSQKYGKYGKISTSLYKKKYIILYEYDNFLTYQRMYPIYT